MDTDTLLDKIKTQPEEVGFKEVMLTIDDGYDYQPTVFMNGAVVNEAGVNEASCKILAFAKLHGLNKEQALACFGKFYRDDVLQHPHGTDHSNIRSFMVCGWGGLEFKGNVLTPKP
ncbi:MAG: HopJ type III effector protein [Gammaproteobacteria bacterium]|nr:HopJ type III effector protein [Gammaproteobacteria bacterium]